MSSELSHVDRKHPHEQADPSAALGLEIHPMIQRSQEAFRRALPELLQQKKLFRQWVAYHGDTRVGIAKAEDDLYEECVRRGLKDHEYVVRCIVPKIPGDSDATPSFEV